MKAMKQRALIFGVSIGLLSLGLVTAAWAGDGKIAANPAAAHYPTTYKPKPGDLLFYTNGSISYNSKAKHSWVVVIDAKTKKTKTKKTVTKKTVPLTMEDFYFKPKDVTVPAGSLVTFKLPNPGQVAHNFASAALKIPPHDVNTGDIGTVTWKADVAPGTYKFVCTYHPGMVGTITVK